MQTNFKEQKDSIMKFREHIRQPNISLQEEREKLAGKLLKAQRENKNREFFFLSSLLFEISRLERKYK
jgi:hypothetical protein